MYEKCIVVQFIRDWRFENMFGGEVILRGPGKREIRNPVFCTTREGEGGEKEGLCIFSLLMVISFS